MKWRPVLWGLGLQCILGVLILRWEPGYQFFRMLGDGVRVFLEFADEGSIFVFGEKGVEEHPMAFKVSCTKVRSFIYLFEAVMTH